MKMEICSISSFINDSNEIQWSKFYEYLNIVHHRPVSCAQEPNYIHQDERDWMNHLPIGMRFCPTDQELIECYLKPRVLGFPIPASGIIGDTNIYDHKPEDLKDLTYVHDDGHMYFFTRLKRKDNSKAKLERVVDGGKFGFWKATQKRTDVLDKNNITIGTKASLTHNIITVNEENEKMVKKEDWLMAEYRLPEIFYQQHVELADKDEIALCVIYLTPRAKSNQKIVPSQ